MIAQTRQVAAHRISVVLLAIGICLVPVSLLSVSAQPPEPVSTPLSGGGKIAFASNRDGNYEIYVMNPDGSEQTRLTYDPANDTYPVFSPDGSKIAFVSKRDGSRQIYLMNVDGSGLTRLTDSPEDSAYPAFSPDGSKIAFCSSFTYYDLVPGINKSCDIYVMNADGSNRTRLTHNPPIGAPAVGLGLDGLPYYNPVFNFKPQFNADGSRIIFQSDRSDGVGFSGIYAMSIDGSGQTQLTTICCDTSPTASPDGRRIAFVSCGISGFGIYVMNSDGLGRTRLSDDGGPSSLSQSAEDWLPSFSPDSSKIVFQRDDEIYVMNADGSGRTRLTYNSAKDSRPSWGPTVSATTTPTPAPASS